MVKIVQVLAVILGMSSLQTSAEAFSPSINAEEAIVIGGGRIGSLISADDAKLIGRSDRISTSIDPNGAGPIYIATRNDVLSSIVDDCPTSRRRDLVFLQNGYLDNFLRDKGLLENTQALLYLSVTAKGVDPVDGITSVSPEGLTAATGVHAQTFANRLAKLGLKCNVVRADEYRPAMFEKLIWIATYMLVGTAKDCISVGQVGSEHRQLVRDVISELTAAVAIKERITFATGTIDRLEAYTAVVASFPCGVKEFEWRNKYFYDLGDIACSIHNGLLRQCAERNKLGFDLPVIHDTPRN